MGAKLNKFLILKRKLFRLIRNYLFYLPLDFALPLLDKPWEGNSSSYEGLEVDRAGRVK